MIIIIISHFKITYNNIVQYIVNEGLLGELFISMIQSTLHFHQREVVSSSSFTCINVKQIL